MAGLVVVDEKGSVIKDANGFPHAHLLLHYDAPSENKWLGFFPNGELYGNVGLVLTEPRESFIDNYVRFAVSKDKLDLIASKLVSKYNKTVYNLGVCDCVSFAADACRLAGISVPHINMTPGGFVWWLIKFKSNQTHVNVRPYPWASTSKPESSEATGSRKHKVVAGDTLSGLAKRYYGKASEWQKIYRANAKLIGPNPNRILVGQEFVIPA